ncbi:MAG TPA: metalloregulator ArsR/SmtB family transcription factor [Nocardioidaceae bacterium]|nr:metalloregulator ArsR/SmtB family transcription factor [Nocardioidaceae bacterium]
MLTSVQSDVLRVLADPLRMRIVELLSREQLCTCHIVDETGARQTNVSNHLRILREVGLVEAEPAGRYTYYRLVPEALDDLATSLSNLAVGARTTSDVRRPSCD